MSDTVIRYEIAPLRLYFIGGLLVLFWLPFAAITVLRIYLFIAATDARQLVVADGIVVFGALFFGGLALYAFGLAWRKPVGLRLDAHGVSGFFSPTLSWADIRAIPERPIKKGIMIDLKDPEGFWAKQSAWARINNAISLQAKMVEINIGPIKAQSHEIIEKMREMHARYGS